MSTPVLYDVPGPAARRRALISALVAGAVLLALLALVVQRLADNGQFEGDKWSSLFDPSDDRFELVWKRLGAGIRLTLEAAGLAILFSLAIGTVLAVLRLTLGRWARLPVVLLIELLRGVPVVIAIFFASRVLPAYDIDLDTLWYLVIGLTAYNCVVIAEIIRAGVNALPSGQQEAALAVGLTRLQALRLVQLPQAVRVMLPALISQLVVVLKDTSLGAIILYPETLRTAQILIQNLKNPIQMYLVIALLFIAVNYAISRLATYVERRLSRPATARGVRAVAPAATGE